MGITLSWDLFVIVFFIVIVAYSFIIGRNLTLKIIISTYIAILTADGIGNIVERFISPKILSLLFPNAGFATAAVIIKILIFVAVIVILAMRGEFQVNLSEEGSYIVSFVVNLIFGLLSAGLVISTILFFMSGGSFLQTTGALVNEAIMSVKRGSPLMQNLIDNYNLWFSLPAIAFAFTSLFKKSE